MASTFRGPVQSAAIAPARRRPGKRPIDPDLWRAHRLDIDLNAAELEHCKQQANVAAMPLRRWARRALTGIVVTAARPLDLRRLWSESSTLQSDFNQLTDRLNQLHASGELTLENAGPALVELVPLVSEIHQLVRRMRVELADGGSAR